MSSCLLSIKNAQVPERSKKEDSNASLTNFKLYANHKCVNMNNFGESDNSSKNQKTWKNTVFEEKRFGHGIFEDDGPRKIKKRLQEMNKMEKKEKAITQNAWNASNCNNSTLSLHIAAYENSIKNENSHALQEDLEFPRGNENESKEPEVMQFKATQKLLDPNKSPSKQQNPTPALTPIKNIEGKGGEADAIPTTPTKPMKRRSSVSLVADLSKCAKINVDDYIDKLMTSVDKDGNITDYLTDTAVIEQICVLAIENLSKQPPLLELSPKINIVGDIHGQFIDLLRIFELCGHPSKTKYLFLGDYVDRGPNSLGVICLLLLLRVRYPDTFFLLRGNHECSTINRAYGFLHECEDRFQHIPIDETIWGIQEADLKGTQVWYRFQDVFNWLPMTALIGKKILCMHGGLSPDLVSLDQLRKLERPIDPENAGIHIDLLWADPDPAMKNGEDDSDWGPSARGISSHFNVKAVNSACTRLGLDMIVRGHQVVQDGYEFFANRKLVTIFSAPNYCGSYHNSGAVMTVDINLETTFHVLKPQLGSKKKSKATEVNFDDIDIDALIAEGSAEKC